MNAEPATTNAGSGPLTRDVAVLNRYGIHARPAALLVKAATRFPCEILIEKNGVKVNAKSIMGMMTLGLDMGDSIEVSTNGTDEEKAMEAIVEYLSAK